jgi:lipid-binding SYLF domain-containing protein
VLIFPNLIRAAFLFGGEGGVGVLLARDTNGTWSSPAFFGMGSGSFGLQAGVQTAAVLFLIMTDGALNKIMTTDVKLGGDLSIALGPIGAGLQANTTTNLKADIIAYAKTAGLYGGLSIEGSVIDGRESQDKGYYGPGATPRAILIERRFNNPGANALKAALADRR